MVQIVLNELVEVGVHGDDTGVDAAFVLFHALLLK